MNRIFYLKSPSEEAKNILQKLGKCKHLLKGDIDIKWCAFVFCHEVMEFSSLTTYSNCFKEYWKEVQKEIIKYQLDKN